MSKINQILLKSKFRGCLFGSLIGDCYGAPFAGDSFESSTKIVLQKYFDKLEGPHFKAPVKKCTKEALMTKCVAQSLLEDPLKLEPTKLAKLFVKEYFLDPKRDYAEGTITVFHKLRANKFQDPFKPASEESQQNDNGAAMRSSPIALFYHDNYDGMIDRVKLSAQITHAQKQGVTGAILHAIAVNQSLMSDPKSKLNIDIFVTDIIKKLKNIESDEEGLGIENPTPFANQMEVVLDILKNTPNSSDEEIIGLLGHSMLAVYSVPTAIYCFLRAQSDIENIQTSNPFRRTLQYAISLGGDTSAITGMAGSIAGAYYGEEEISKSLIKHCEYSEEFLQIADKLYALKFAN